MLMNNVILIFEEGGVNCDFLFMVLGNVIMYILNI